MLLSLHGKGSSLKIFNEYLQDNIFKFFNKQLYNLYQPNLLPLSSPPFSMRTASRASVSYMNCTNPYPRNNETAEVKTRDGH